MCFPTFPHLILYASTGSPSRTIHRLRRSNNLPQCSRGIQFPQLPYIVSHYLQASELTPLLTAQHWSKTIQKAFKERYPGIFKDGDDNNPATPSKEGAGPRTPKTPASGKGKGKGRKRAAPSDDEDEDASPKSGVAKKTPRTSAKKMKYSEDPTEDDEEKQAVVKGETVDED